jgi:polyferredoxin
VQLFFLLAFFGVVVLARSQPNTEVNHLVEIFFHFDPLILIATLLSAHAVHGAVLAIGTIVLTLLLGRVFCGWVCPLGTIHAIAGRVFDRFQSRSKRRDHWSRWQLAKYYLLAGFLAMAVFGVHWGVIWDPLVLLYRTTTTALMPGLQWGVEQGSTAVYKADPGVGSVRLTQVTEPAYGFLRDHVFNLPGQAFLGGGLILLVFVAMVLANGYRRRFWCRYLCPLGALLGLLSWRPFVRREVNKEKCNQCDLCAMTCHGAAGKAPGDQWKPAECFGCLNCTDACHRDSLHFRWVAPWHREPAVEGIDLSKRALLASAVGGIVALPLLRANPQSRGKVYHPALVRPPGSREEKEFLARCTSCGLCMKVCPTGGLQPSLTEAGLEGLWTPRLVPQIGYCDYTCTLCGQVCPTEAIVRLTEEEKHKVRIGLASFDTTRCIPYAYGRDCMVCEEHCPIPDKAIYCLEVEIRDRNGQVKTIKQPHVDPDKCIGCGVCESVCPFKDRPGIRVTSANESRHPALPGTTGNQPILPEDSPY